MKKVLISIFLIGITIQLFGQLNPINNLTWEQWYMVPQNFFDLDWDSPDPSQDSLIGYNIYRDSLLYRFQTEDRLYHTAYGGENCPEEFLNFGNGEFWIHVTAVYNSTNDESNYIDSAHCMGPLMGINEMNFQKRKLFPNPTTGELQINYKSIEKIIIINQSGQILKEYKQESKINLSDLSNGIYFIKVITIHGDFVNRIILE